MALSGALLCALCRSVLGKEYCSVVGSDSERRSDSRGSASGRNTKRFEEMHVNIYADLERSLIRYDSRDGASIQWTLSLQLGIIRAQF